MVTGFSPAAVEAARKAIPYVEAIASDAGDPKAAKALVNRVKKKRGRIDVLFVNAWIARVAPLAAADEAHFDELFRRCTFRTTTVADPGSATGFLGI